VEQMMDKATIPYEEIDCEIRQLVKLLNEFPGIRTEFSCAGHTEDEETYVSFRAESLDRLEAVLAALPFIGARSDIMANQFRWRSICVDVALLSEGGLRHTIRIAGRPEYIQRRLVGEVERSLANSLAHLQEAHPPYSTCVAGHNAGT
jgi:hypothetical protein